MVLSSQRFTATMGERRERITTKKRGQDMIDHVILTVSDFGRSVAFYAKALKPLGITNFTDYEGTPRFEGFW
jgi:hypothetical protein